MAFSTHDVVPDSPINNFATWSPIDPRGGLATPSNGNLTYNNAVIYFSNLPLQENTYVEFYVSAGVTTTSAQFGVSTFDHAPSNRRIWGGNGQFYNGNWGGGLTSYTTGDVIALHLNNSNQVAFYKNGSLVNSFALPNGDVWLEARRVSSSTFGTANFGQDPTFGGATSLPAGAGDYDTDTAGASTGGRFAFQPPAGALALCTQNLPEGPIKLSQDETPSDNFKAVKYTGNGTGQSITGVGFQPDLIWAKSRSSATSHALADSVRGPRKILGSNNTTSEYSETSGTTLLSFDSDGFTVGTDGNYTAFTSNNSSIVAWCWKAAGSPADNQAKIINEDGSAMDATAAEAVRNSGSIVPSKISANRQNGFSIVKYTGTGANATVPHGLSSAPEVIIVKNLDDTGGRNWIVYHHKATSTPQEDYLLLNKSDSSGTQPLYWNNTYPTSSVFSIGIANAVTYPSQAHIVYCWHSVEGYSKCGSYVGNGSTDGPMVYCGFRPAWVMVKGIEANNAHAWKVWNNASDPYNLSVKPLWPNLPNSEVSGLTMGIDFLSNGFKIRSTDVVENDAYKYIYMAFAEQPFSGPSNAR